MNKTESEWEGFFYEAKAAGQMVHVTDRWGVTREGRLYRCGFDRLNVVPLDDNGVVGTEVYYSDVRSADVIGPEPAGLMEFHMDWNRRSRG